MISDFPFKGCIYSWDEWKTIPEEPGVYAIFFKSPDLVPSEYSELKKIVINANGLIYVGIPTSGTVRDRLKNHRGNSSSVSAFRRNLAALLIKQMSMVPYQVKGKTTYHFPNSDEKKLTDWIVSNTYFRAIMCDRDLALTLEKRLIGKYSPLLNKKDNPECSLLLKELIKHYKANAKQNGMRPKM